MEAPRSFVFRWLEAEATVGAGAGRISIDPGESGGRLPPAESGGMHAKDQGAAHGGDIGAEMGTRDGQACRVGAMQSSRLISLDSPMARQSDSPLSDRRTHKTVRLTAVDSGVTGGVRWLALPLHSYSIIYPGCR